MTMQTEEAQHDDNVVLVPLTQGKFAKVDASIAPLVHQKKWAVTKGRNTFYAISTINNNHRPTSLTMHKLIYECVRSLIPQGMEIDHINGDGLDNRIENLRMVNKRQQHSNRANHRNGKLVGSHWNKKKQKWSGHIYFNGTCYHLGYFKDELQASQAYQAALTNWQEHGILPPHKQQEKL